MNQLKNLKSIDSELNAMITSIEDSPIVFHIEENKRNHYNRKTKTIGYNPDNNTRQDGEQRPAEAALAHELGHAENDKNNASVNYNTNTKNKDASHQNELDKKNKNEVNSIYYENIVREHEGYPQRGYNYVNGD